MQRHPQAYIEPYLKGIDPRISLDWGQLGPRSKLPPYTVYGVVYEVRDGVCLDVYHLSLTTVLRGSWDGLNRLKKLFFGIG